MTDDSADDDLESLAPPRKAPEPAKKVAKSKSTTVKEPESKSSSQSDGDAVSSKPPAKSKAKAAAPKKTTAPKKPPVARKKAADSKQPSIMDSLTKPKMATKTAAKKFSFDSSDDEAPPKAPVTKAEPMAKRKQIGDQDDSDSESDNLMARIRGKTTTTTAKKTKKWEDDSFEMSDQESAAPVAVAPKDKPSRAKKPLSYKLDSDSDEEFGF